MNTTTKRLIGISIFLASCSPVAAWAIPPLGFGQAWLASAAAGDDGPTDAQKADELLHQARKAMSEGQYAIADSCISRAEKLNPKYGIFHTGDTPKKARTDLNRKLGLRADGSSYGAGSPGTVPPVQSPEGPKDPFLARNDGGASQGANQNSDTGANAGSGAPHAWPVDASSGEQPMRLPPVGPSAAPANVAWGEPAPNGYPSTGLPPVNVGQGNNDGPRGNAAAANPRAQSDSLLLNARKALAVGDARRAASLVDQAKGLQVHYELTEDSPAKVETIIHRYNDLMSQSIPHDSDAYRHQYAGLLMEQAQWLLRWHEFDESERLASTAKQMPINTTQSKLAPTRLLEQIASEQHRRQRSVCPGGRRSARSGAARRRRCAWRRFGGREAASRRTHAASPGRIGRGGCSRGRAACPTGGWHGSRFGLWPAGRSAVAGAVGNSEGAAASEGSGVVLAGAEGPVDSTGRHFAARVALRSESRSEPRREQAGRRGGRAPTVRPSPESRRRCANKAAEPLEPANDRAPAMRCNCSAAANEPWPRAIATRRRCGYSVRPTANPDQLDAGRLASACKIILDA